MTYDLEYWQKWRSTTASTKHSPASYNQSAALSPSKQFDERYRKALLSSKHGPAHPLRGRQSTFPKEQRFKTTESPTSSIQASLLSKGRDNAPDESQLPATSIGGAIGLESRNRRHSDESLGPGPGEYVTPNRVGEKQVTSDMRTSTAHTFSQSSRSLPVPTYTGPGPIYAQPSSLSKTGGRFSQSARDKGDKGDRLMSTPGPGEYAPQLPQRRYSYSMGTGFKGSSSDELFNVFTSSGFGYGCDVQQHIKFGRCLDGQCSKRASWERQGSTVKHLKYLGNAKPPVHLLILNSEAPFADVANRLLTDEALDLNETDDNGRTVLHNLCINENSLDCNSKLIFIFQFCQQYNRAIDIDRKDVDGNTALLLAVRNGLEVSVETLLLLGANPAIMNNEGVSALSLSMEQQNHAIYQHVRASVMLRDLRSRISHGMQQKSALQNPLAKE